jgi:type I restriction enzyme M protein
LNQINSAIAQHSEFVEFADLVSRVFSKWKARNSSVLMGISTGTRPSIVIEALSEDLLRTFSTVDLVDKYDMYQQLMSYWTDTMQDDIYLIVTEGWQANTDLVPPELIKERHFASEQKIVAELEYEKDEIVQQIEQLVDENTGEDGLLEEVVNERGNITKTLLKARIKEIEGDHDYHDELAVLNRYLTLKDQFTLVTKNAREAQKTLATKVMSHYQMLSEDEVKQMVVRDKWIASMDSKATIEIDRISGLLAARLLVLAERYAKPLPKLLDELEILQARVDQHLLSMGYVCD